MGALRDPLEQLAERIEDLLGQRTAEQRLALGEVLDLIREVKRERAEIEAEHVEGRVYGPRERFVWQPGDVTVRPGVEYEVRDSEGRVVEIVLKDGTRLYAEDTPGDS